MCGAIPLPFAGMGLTRSITSTGSRRGGRRDVRARNDKAHRICVPAPWGWARHPAIAAPGVEAFRVRRIQWVRRRIPQLR
jgi:hypothetical protein